MSGAVLLVAFIIAVALAFDYINGFHDAANSIATVVSTRVLTPMQAVAWAAFFNFVAAFGFGVQVARTVGKGVVDAAVVDEWVILGGLIGAITWNLITWYFGIPTSSSHALIGGCSGFSLRVATLWIFRRARQSRVDALFRRLQLVSAAFYSLGHGTNDAQKTMGLIAILLFSRGDRTRDHGRRLAHRQDHGDAADQAAPGRRLLRRDGRGRDADRHGDRRHS